MALFYRIAPHFATRSNTILDNRYLFRYNDMVYKKWEDFI